MLRSRCISWIIFCSLWPSLGGSLRWVGRLSKVEQPFDRVTVSMQDHFRVALLALFQMASLTGAACAGNEIPSTDQERTIALEERQIRAAGIETQAIEQESGAGNSSFPEWWSCLRSSCAWLRRRRRGW